VLDCDQIRALPDGMDALTSLEALRVCLDLKFWSKFTIAIFGDCAIWRRPSLGGLDSSLESVVSCSAFSTCFLGRSASPRPVGLALAHLGPPLSCHVDPGSCDAPQAGLGHG